jgi:hypothetical protein
MSSDTVDTYRAMKEHRKALRAAYGVACPMCAVKRPRAPASILLPQQTCRVDRYKDPRPELTDEQWKAV